MKKFKLIKEYPGSPKLGYIAEFKNYQTWYHNFLPKLNDNDELNSIGCHEITLYPEFWEEVVEKEYKILSFVNNGTARGMKGFIVPLQEDGRYYSKGRPDSGTDDSEEGCLKKSYLDIHSVKRLSDSEVFTVGDELQYYSITGQKLHTHIIDNIAIYQNNVLLNHDHGTWKSHGDFNKVQKVKQSLFTTEDGVDVFEQDEIHYVSVTDLCLTGRSPANYFAKEQLNGSWLFFKHHDNLLQYLAFNRVQLSFKDIEHLLTKKGREVLLKQLKS